jgi:hypothetical protein
VVTFLHGGSPFKVSQPDSFRIRLDRRSTFNYSRDILEIREGDGGELGTPENVGKLYSLWSSSALLCNVFDYWRERTLAPLLTALSVQNSSYEQPGFEQTFRTGVRSARANVDVIFRACGSACLPVAIESKFTEPYQPGEKERLRPSYFQK